MKNKNPLIHYQYSEGIRKIIDQLIIREQFLPKRQRMTIGRIPNKILFINPQWIPGILLLLNPRWERALSSIDDTVDVFPIDYKITVLGQWKINYHWVKPWNILFLNSRWQPSPSTIVDTTPSTIITQSYPIYFRIRLVNFFIYHTVLPLDITFLPQLHWWQYFPFQHYSA